MVAVINSQGGKTQRADFHPLREKVIIGTQLDPEQEYRRLKAKEERKRGA